MMWNKILCSKGMNISKLLELPNNMGNILEQIMIEVGVKVPK